MHRGSKKGAGAEDHGAAANQLSTLETCAGNAPLLDDHIDNLCLENLQPIDLRQARLRCRGIEVLVVLGARRPHGGAFRPAKRFELDTGEIGQARHLPTERVDLADQLSLGHSPHCGVARQPPDRRGVHRDQQRCASEARPGRGCLNTCMSSADHQQINRPSQMFHVKLFADTKRAENLR
jgi:hypothetical protein